MPTLPTNPTFQHHPFEHHYCVMMGQGPDWGKHRCATEGPKRDWEPLCSCSGWKCREWHCRRIPLVLQVLES